MLIRDRLTTYPGGPPKVGTPVELRLVAGDALLLSTSTDSDGFFDFELNGYPGPVYWTATDGAEVREVYGDLSLQMGNLSGDELTEMFGLFNDGIIEGLEVTSTGAMGLSVSAGAAIGVKNMYVQRAAEAYTVGANASGNPRIDSIFVRINGSTGDYVTEAVLIAGTPAASPAAPTDSVAGGLSFRLANIAVANGAGSLSGANITDTRDFSAPTIGDTSVHLDQLSQSGATTGQVPGWNGTNWVPTTVEGSGTELPDADDGNIAGWFGSSWTAATLSHLRAVPYSKTWTNDVLLGAGATLVKDQLTVTPAAGITYDAIFVATADLRGIGGGGACKATMRVAGTGGSNYDVICRTVGGVSNRGSAFGYKEGIVGDGATAFTVTFTVIHNAATDQLTIEPGQIFLVLLPRIAPKVAT